MYWRRFTIWYAAGRVLPFYQLNCYVQHGQVGAAIFRAFDSFGEEELTLEAFLCGLAVVVKGTSADCAAWLYAFYDMKREPLGLRVDALGFLLNALHRRRDGMQIAASLRDVSSPSY
jgi:hypothetical protein